MTKEQNILLAISRSFVKYNMEWTYMYKFKHLIYKCVNSGMYKSMSFLINCMKEWTITYQLVGTITLRQIDFWIQ